MSEEVRLVLFTYIAQSALGIGQVWKQGSDALCVVLFNTP